jgi:hypothetical protein
MAIITVKELAARYRLAARRQALVERFKAAETRFKPGDRVRVKPTHNFKEWHGDVGEVDKFVPFGKYYVELEKNGRVIIDGDYLEKAEAKKASFRLYASDITGTLSTAQIEKVALDDSFKDAAFAFLRESKFSWLAMGMSEEAKRAGITFGMRDVAGVLKAWFANRKPEGPKEEAGYRYIQGGAGRMLMDRLIRGVQKALQSTGARVGLKDVGEAIVAFAEDR